MSALNQWVNAAAKQNGIAADRLSWFIASTVVMGVLQRATAGDGSVLFLVKGGAFLERRLQLKSRSTKDVDALFRGTLDEFKKAVAAVTDKPWGPFTIQLKDMAPIAGAQTSTPPQRFHLQLLIKGQVFRKVKVEVSFGEGGIATQSEVMPIPRLDHFGITAPEEIATITLAYQIGQKLHAATDPDTPERQNDRVRDIVDLILIRNAFYSNGENLLPVLRAAQDIFAARAAIAAERGATPRLWPPLIKAQALWPTEWNAPAAQANVTLTLDEALEEVRQWVVSINSAADVGVEEKDGTKVALAAE
ncbi:nucleotidyl transferase AbiEii/AbiGii toxin family protein [Rathayibacter sp. AY1E9]|uniref:nucleotidyl transferase AbiEii/AbiGii toxin family protein n=1 Tax=Rathayibacter sp. AY1E9 TaxID=2080556 RepID=UPI0015E20197|nr:nucleotidyl transferase AbiEii/AbiGii toxin family protein [Rathayibacter sp. AY1E9]